MKFLDSNIVKGSLILLISINLFNLLNFIFQIFMVRMLSVPDYGILASLFSIVYIFLIFNDSIQLVVTKYSAEENDKSKLKNLLKRSIKKSAKIASILFGAYVILSVFLKYYLDISYTLLVLNGLFIFTVFFIPITRGIIQGRRRFNQLGINMIIDASLKLVIGLFLVYIGLSVYGAILGAFLGSAIAFLLSFIVIKDITRAKEKFFKTKNIYSYTKPAFLITLVIAMFYSLDVLIARFVFSAEIAGFYAVSATLAKIIFLGTSPISKAMFPLSIEEDKKTKSNRVITNSFIMIGSIIAAALLVFYFFPDIIIRIFSGSYLPSSASILFYIGISSSIISLANLNLLHKLSLGHTRGYQYLVLFVIIEVLLLIYFSNNLIEFSLALIASSAFFLWGSIILPKKND